MMAHMSPRIKSSRRRCCCRSSREMDTTLWKTSILTANLNSLATESVRMRHFVGTQYRQVADWVKLIAGVVVDRVSNFSSSSGTVVSITPKQWCIQHKIDPMVYFAHVIYGRHWAN